MESSFSLNEVKNLLKNHICEAAQVGLNNVNNNTNQFGKFEDKFQDGFSRYFSEQQAPFPAHLGTVAIIKVLYTSYNHYLGAINFGKSKIEWSDKDRRMMKYFKDLKKGYFDAQYQSQSKGDYLGKYQLMQLQSQIGGFKDERKKVRATASYLVFDSPNDSKKYLATNVFLVPVQSFQRAVHESPHGRLNHVIPAKDGEYEADDVGSLTAFQLNEVLDAWTVRLIPQPNDNSIGKPKVNPIVEWLGNFISDDFYSKET